MTAADHQLQIAYVDPRELSPYERNPRRGNVEAIAASLTRHGQFRALTVRRKPDDTLEVLAGNHTLAAALSLGWTSIAVSEIPADDEEAARIVLADNRLADLGTYDDAELVGLLQTLPDLDATGYLDADLDMLLRATGALGDDVAGMFDEHAAEHGGPARAAKDDDGEMHSAAGGYVTASWTILPEQRDIVRRAIKIVQKRLELPTSAEAVIAMAQEVIDREEKPGA